MASKFFQEALNNVPTENKIFAKLSCDFVEKINNLLNQMGISKAQLAILLEISLDELEDWLSPLYDISLKQLSKIESALDIKIIEF